MKNTISLLTIALMFVTSISKAQTPMQIDGLDCNGTSHDMFSELNAGKAVVVFFYMPNCSSCPPPAQEIQAMANNILASHPNMITAYAFPFQNSTPCVDVATWTSVNNLPMYSPYDSGAVQVANYGGFGMPTVVLLGGTDHRVMFSTLSYSTSDTTIMRDSILSLFAPLGLQENSNAVNSINIFPNPSSSNATITLELNKIANVSLDVMDITGRKILAISNEKNVSGTISRQLNTANMPTGVYNIRINIDGNIINRKINVTH